ncbi:hypothetical protein GX408_01790 [bacterium]|nr:hypothetical protein [bacterium]
MHPAWPNKRSVRLFLFLLLLSGSAASARVGLGVQAAIWKPSSLDHEPSRPFRAIPGSGISYGLMVQSPEWQSFSLQLSAWKWQQTQEPEMNVVTLWHLSCDVKNSLLNQTLLRPYATYGFAAVLGKPNSRPLQRDGLSINLGAGVEYRPFPRIGLAFEYQYLYLLMDRNIGFTDDLSGPKLTFKFIYTL